MITTKTITDKYCDVCGKAVESFATCEENHPMVITSLVFNVFYDGTRMVIDVCNECNDKIVNILTTNTQMERNWVRK